MGKRSSSIEQSSSLSQAMQALQPLISRPDMGISSVSKPSSAIALSVCEVNSSVLPLLRGLPTIPITFMHSPPYINDFARTKDYVMLKLLRTQRPCYHPDI